MHTYFLKKEKKILYPEFTFYSKNQQINYIMKYLKKHERSTNKFENVHNFFEIF
jgi:hypothetical protein